MELDKFDIKKKSHFLNIVVGILLTSIRYLAQISQKRYILHKYHRNATYYTNLNILMRFLNTPVSAKMAQGQGKWHG